MCEKLNKILFVLFLFSSISNYSLAQSFNNNDDAPCGNGGVSPIHKLIEDIDPVTSFSGNDQQVRIRFAVSMVNLQELCYGDPLWQDCPEHRQYLGYPKDKEYADLYVRYRVGDIVSTPKKLNLGDFVKKTNQHHLHADGENHGQHDLWQANVWSQNFDSDCVNSVFISLQLLTKVGEDEYILYPINEYNGIGDIFDYSIFDHDPSNEECLMLENSGCPAISIFNIPLCAPPSSPCGDGMDIGNERSDGNTNSVQYRRLKCGPNPFTNEINYTISSNIDDEVEVSLLDFQGRLLYSKKKEVSPGVNYEHMHLHTLPSGAYHLQIKTKTYTESIKLVKR